MGFGPVLAFPTTSFSEPALDRDFLDPAMRSNRGTSEGPAEYHYEYLLVMARKRES